jgi:hypothetical protein
MRCSIKWRSIASRPCGKATGRRAASAFTRRMACPSS